MHCRTDIAIHIKATTSLLINQPNIYNYTSIKYYNKAFNYETGLDSNSSEESLTSYLFSTCTTTPFMQAIEIAIYLLINQLFIITRYL